MGQENVIESFRDFGKISQISFTGKTLKTKAESTLADLALVCSLLPAPLFVINYRKRRMDLKSSLLISEAIHMRFQGPPVHAYLLFSLLPHWADGAELQLLSAILKPKGDSWVPRLPWSSLMTVPATKLRSTHPA